MDNNYRFMRLNLNLRASISLLKYMINSRPLNEVALFEGGLYSRIYGIFLSVILVLHFVIIRLSVIKTVHSISAKIFHIKTYIYI